MAARAAMGNAKRKPMTMIAMRPIISKMMSIHQNSGSDKFMICSRNRSFHLLFSSSIEKDIIHCCCCFAVTTLRIDWSFSLRKDSYVLLEP